MEKLKKYKTSISLLILVASALYSFYVLMPYGTKSLEAEEAAFSAERAAIHLKEISKEKHPSGSLEVLTVRDYLISQLDFLGLESEVQSGEVTGRWEQKKITIHNILTRIKGSGHGKALLILAHYDSHPNSYGAGDDGSGVVSILEWARAYVTSGTKSRNDIIILFTDAEEQGMLGAKLFTQSHSWAKDVGFAINFEGRGSGGPSFTLVETNDGNAKMIEVYSRAKIKQPLASSLFYSVYKHLPNDGDSRILRENLDINGFLFAFMDDHFDYHKSTDTYDNMNLNSIQHQGNYLMPLADAFANTNLSDLKTDENVVFFNFPFFGIVSYSYDLIFPLLFLILILFFWLTIYGFRLKRLSWKMIGRGALAFILTLLICSSIGLIGVKIIPDLKFASRMPINGHLYTLFFTFLSLAALIQVSHRLYKSDSDAANFLIAPIFFWILLNFPIAIYLKGANYFLFPVIFALISLFISIRRNRSILLINTLLAVPMIFILAPMIKFFPLALGPKLMLISTLLLAMMLGLMQAVVSQLKSRNIISTFCFLSAIGIFIYAYTMY